MPAGKCGLTIPASSTTPADSAAAGAASHLDASSPEPGQKRRRSARVQDRDLRLQLQQATQQLRAGAPPSKGVNLSSSPVVASRPEPAPEQEPASSSQTISKSGLPGQNPKLKKKKKLRATPKQTKQAAASISAASTAFADDCDNGNTGATEHPDVHVHVHDCSTRTRLWRVQ